MKVTNFKKGSFVKIAVLSLILLGLFAAVIVVSGRGKLLLGSRASGSCNARDYPRFQCGTQKTIKKGFYGCTNEVVINCDSNSKGRLIRNADCSCDFACDVIASCKDAKIKPTPTLCAKVGESCSPKCPDDAEGCLECCSGKRCLKNDNGVFKCVSQK